MDKIMQEVLNLAPADRARVALEIIGSLSPDRPSVTARADAMFKAMESVTGQPFDMKSKDNVSAWNRAIVAHALYKEGYSETAIGLALSRDHSTVNHMKKNMETAFRAPSMFADVVDRFNRFSEALNAKTA